MPDPRLMFESDYDSSARKEPAGTFVASKPLFPLNFERPMITAIILRSNTVASPLFALPLFAISLFALAASAQSQSAASGLTDNPVYQKNCAKCHGKTAEGRHFGGPSLASEKVAAASSEDLANIINNGKGRMPKYAGKLSPDEITTLVQQIQSLNKKSRL